jgi:hypothetical protein
MRRQVRSTTRAAMAAWLGLGGAAAVFQACDRRPPEPAAPQDAGASSTASSAPSPAVVAALARHPRDDAGHLIPKSAPPPLDPSAIAARAGREPDWDLDRDDPARDYVRRYASATMRYGATLDCVTVGPSQPSGERRRVDVKAAAGCKGAGDLRDVFVVDVAADRLSVDDRSKRDPLARWPDGSDPEGPPNPVRDGSQMRAWQGALKDAIREQQIVPIRVQAYGRGTYPVVTLAGWHATVTPPASPDDLRPFADALCRANGGLPLAFFGGLDRTTLLRVRCPGGARWETL